MAIYMPPIARKKRVPEKYNPDTYRVISTNAETFHPKFPASVIKPIYESDTQPTRKILPDIPIRQTRVLTKPISDFRANNPHPKKCDFLRCDVRLLNEPICTVNALEDQHNWWANETSNEPLHQPEHTLDSTYRKDFLYRRPQNVPSGSNRHLANPNKEPALGSVTNMITKINNESVRETHTKFDQSKEFDLSEGFHCQSGYQHSVPVNLLKGRDGKQRFFKENISFEHEYNSRTNPNYPIRSKRQGAFVWDQMSEENRQKFIEHQEMMKQYEKTILNEQSEKYPCVAEEEQQEPATHASPRPSDKSANNSVRSSVSQMSIPCNKKMTPAATPIQAATPQLAATTDGIQQDSPQESVFYEQDVGTQTSPNIRNPSPSPKQLNVTCDATTEISKPADHGNQIPSRNE